MDHVDQILAQWHQERPDLEVGSMGTIGRIQRLSRHLLREMEKTFAQFGLNRASFDVIATLRRLGPPYALSPGDLMAWTMVTSGTMTNRIDQLEKAGLVERIRNPQDGRGFLISLTPRGLEIAEKAVTAHVATQTRLVAGLTNTQRAQLDGLLRVFLASVESESRNSSGGPRSTS